MISAHNSRELAEKVLLRLLANGTIRSVSFPVTPFSLTICGTSSDDVLEQYALGNPVLPEVQEHLVICSACLDRLEEVDEFIAAMRSAAARCRGLKLKKE
jgi:hypothetical protein